MGGRPILNSDPIAETCGFQAPTSADLGSTAASAGSVCTIRSTTGGTVSEVDSKLVVSSSSISQWLFYRSGSYYALKLVGADKFITSAGPIHLSNWFGSPDGCLSCRPCAQNIA